MKSALVAVFALSASLSLSASPSPFQITPPDSDVSVTKLDASRGGGGGGRGGGGGGRGFSGGARGFSVGPRGSAIGVRGGTRFSGQVAPGRLGGTAVRPTGASGQRQVATQGNRGSRQLNTGTAANRANRSLANNRSAASKRSLSNNPNRAAQLRQKQNASLARQNLTTRDGKTHKGQWARNNPVNKGRFGSDTQQRLRNAGGPRSDVTEARQRHRDHCHGNHDHNWWHHHCDTIILVGWGWWGWWNGWWYPTWGYDPYFSYYPYDAPIYAADGLPPDEIIANVQSELQRRGYYHYAVDGQAGAKTQAALNRYQRDRRLPITGTIDQPTLASLGLAQ